MTQVDPRDHPTECTCAVCQDFWRSRGLSVPATDAPACAKCGQIIDIVDGCDCCAEDDEC